MNINIKELKEAVKKTGLMEQTIGFTEKAEFIKLLEGVSS